MQKTILLNDGTEFNVRWCGAAEGILWIDGLNLSFADAIAIFSNPEKTARITAFGGIEHDGYITVIHMSLYEGLLKLALRKEG